MSDRREIKIIQIRGDVLRVDDIVESSAGEEHWIRVTQVDITGDGEVI